MDNLPNNPSSGNNNPASPALPNRGEPALAGGPPPFGPSFNPHTNSQDFLDYYTNQLTNLGFKQTLNSSQPIGTTITFAKDDLFLTFGIKNVFQGSGENKKLVGYKAFIEHN